MTEDSHYYDKEIEDVKTKEEKESDDCAKDMWLSWQNDRG